MPNKSVYVRDEDLPLFQKAQELAGESLSNVIAEAIRQYVYKRELERQEMGEIIIWRGTENLVFDSMDVEKFKFIGRLIAEDTVDDTGINGQTINLILYQTVKGKFLLWSQVDEGPKCVYEFRLYDDANKLYSGLITPKMQNELEKKVGQSHITFLDI